jgi:hypothetical protein
MKKIRVIPLSQSLWLVLPVVFGIGTQLLVDSAVGHLLVAILTVGAVWATIRWLVASGRSDEYVLPDKQDDGTPRPPDTS